MGRDWSHLFSILPHESEVTGVPAWLWGAFEQLRAMLPVDGCTQVDISALSVKYPSRMRASDG